MSLSRLSLPSIRRVLEAQQPQNSSNVRLDQPDAPMTMKAILALGPPNSQTVPVSNSPSSHLMKTIDFRYTTLEDEEEEQLSFIVGFPEEPASDETHRGIEAQGSTTWIKCNLSLLVTAVRGLLPVKIAEALLRKALQH